MDMKRLIINRLVGLGLLVVGVLVLCNVFMVFVFVFLLNFWVDDYIVFLFMENYKQWGMYNVYDLVCKKIGDIYYMYFIDVIFVENWKEVEEKNVLLGFIQVCKLKDLVYWDFVGWVFFEIFVLVIEWVYSQVEGKGVINIWVFFLMFYQGIYCLYYCVLVFGRNIFYIGMVELDFFEGFWIQKGCVVKIGEGDVMNVIDFFVIEDLEIGKWWMYYGFYFGGLYCVELNFEIGMIKQLEDYGYLIVCWVNYWKDNLEVLEIMYQLEFGKYYLFIFYDLLMIIYNVCVVYFDFFEGFFVDFYGEDIKDIMNNVFILIVFYCFENYLGWVGMVYCGFIDVGDGCYFMVYQGCFFFQNYLMDLYVCEVFFIVNGWFVVFFECYVGIVLCFFIKEDLVGEWEIICIQELFLECSLEVGQILWGEGDLWNGEQVLFVCVVLEVDGSVGDVVWGFNVKKQFFIIKIVIEDINNLIIFVGYDWENEIEIIFFIGLDV